MDQSQNQKKPLIRGVDVINGIGNSNFKSFNNNNNNNPWRFFPKRKFDKNNITNNNIPTNYSRSAPFAPRNTTSFIIRSKKSGGIAPLVSPCPVTPTILTTPILSPSRELLVDTAKEEWGVDGYGSMKGLIRLSRFEMIYNPNGANVNNGLENRVDDQDGHIARLEGANLDLKERLFFVERELGDLRRRMVCLEGMGNGSGNESEGRVEEEECEDGLDVGDENNVNDYDNNTIGVESKEESNENSNDSTYANNVDADNVNENHCVDPKVEIKDNCVLVKDYMDLAKDGAN
ncbi:hypothetical protein PHJA_000142700 [Phtheirospermum japonicum]|uniref:Uncharacterized protein n=1 Tax=Phtheirospermum japonicum TaxID=374723 RepID=A0A830B384_9LAMI|nr:hypothetical protein PHJA_000142700 [Phtheirospermum japonicum]